MVVSMTGFASTTMVFTAPDGAHTNITFMLKSLNSRFFEASCKLPYALTHLETELIKLFKQQLHRGHIVFSVQMSNPNVFKGSVQTEMQVVKGYLAACNNMQKQFSIPGELSISDIITLPNIFSLEEQTIDEKTKEKLMQVIHKLLDTLIQARITEGTALQQDISNRIKLIHTFIDSIEKESEVFMQKRKKEITARLKEIDQTVPEFTETQRNMLYYELDKIDIHEEIVRFKTHLTSLENTLRAKEIEKGRRLDFILQELGRETNTITAKCSDSSISSLAINIKVELEKAREQVQNIV